MRCLQTAELRSGDLQVTPALPRMGDDGPDDLCTVHEDLHARETRHARVLCGAVVPGHRFLGRLRDAKVNLDSPATGFRLRNRDREGRVPEVVEPIAVVDVRLSCLR